MKSLLASCFFISCAFCAAPPAAWPEPENPLIGMNEESARAKYGGAAQEIIGAEADPVSQKTLRFEKNGVRVTAGIYKGRVALIIYTRNDGGEFSDTDAEVLIHNNARAWRYSREMEAEQIRAGDLKVKIWESSDGLLLATHFLRERYLVIRTRAHLNASVGRRAAALKEL